MAWLKFHTVTGASQEETVLINSNTIYKVIRYRDKSQLHFTTPSGEGNATLIVNESFEEVAVMLDTENVND